MWNRNMNSFVIKCAIFLLLVLARRLVVANVQNISLEKNSPSKVFTNYLKVPWINLNSSWKDQVLSPCRDDIATLFESADTGEMWALQMLDAASKIPAGIFTGNIRDLGMYEECIRVKGDENPANIQGRHCMVSLSMPPKFAGDATAALYIQKLSPYNPTPDVDLNFAASLCLPSSCGVEDVQSFVNASIKGTPELVEFEVEVAQAICSSVAGSTSVFTWGTILAMSFFGLVASILVFCTACDFVVKVRSEKASLALKTLAKFSLYTNAMKLWSTETPSGTMPAINGIKFFSVCLVVTIHRFLGTPVKTMVNLSAAYEMRESWLSTFFLMAALAVDTFFVINGFLTSYFFLKKMRSGGKLTITELYLHRYLRLTPCIAAMLLLVIFILPHLGSGPLWETVLGVTSDFCRKNWWTNLLYVQNFVNREEMCMPHTWYSAVEMQLFWLCPIILYPLFYRPKLGFVILGMSLTASFIAPAVYLVVNQYSALPHGGKIFIAQYKEFIYSYTSTYNRALPYFVGILLGYFIANNKKKPTKAQASFNWILAYTSVLFCFWNTYVIQPNASVYNAAFEAVYVSVGRLTWSLAIAWILYACTQGYGGLITKFLSLPIFVPLSRMSYGIYLVSVVIQLGINATQQTAEFTSRMAILYLAWGDLGTSIAGAFILNLFFESPVIILEKIIKSRGNPKAIKRSSTAQKDKLVVILKEKANSSHFLVGSDAEIQAKMLQVDFWQTISDVLNASGHSSSKTPMEWVKAWRRWKSDPSRNHGQWKTCPNDIRDGSAQPETGLSTSEKELLAFLDTVIWIGDDIVSCEQGNIAKHTRSQTDSPCSRNGNFTRRTTDINSLPS